MDIHLKILDYFSLLFHFSSSATFSCKPWGTLYILSFEEQLDTSCHTSVLLNILPLTQFPKCSLSPQVGIFSHSSPVRVLCLFDFHLFSAQTVTGWIGLSLLSPVRSTNVNTIRTKKLQCTLITPNRLKSIMQAQLLYTAAMNWQHWLMGLDFFTLTADVDEVICSVGLLWSACSSLWISENFVREAAVQEAKGENMLK